MIPTQVCPIHGAEMTQRRRESQVWYSHRLPDGVWCNGKASRGRAQPGVEEGSAVSSSCLSPASITELDELVGITAEATQVSSAAETSLPAVVASPPLWLCEVTGEPVALHDCLTCSRERRRPECQFNPAILRALANAQEPDEVLEVLGQLGFPIIRVSSLVGCQRKAWYERSSGRPLEKPSEHWARLRGTIFHEALARLGEGLVERRLVNVVRDGTLEAVVSGRVDGYDPATGILHDYKTSNGVSGFASLPLEHHRRQLWMYAWLLAQNGFPPPVAIRVIYITMKEVVSADCPLPADMAKVEEMVLSRVRAVLDPDAPPARPDESWECRYCPFSQCPAYAKRSGGNGKNGK